MFKNNYLFEKNLDKNRRAESEWHCTLGIPASPLPLGSASTRSAGVWWRSSREIDVLVCPQHLFLKYCVAVHYLSLSIRSLLHGVQQGGKSAGFHLIVLLYLSIQLLNSFIFCSIMQRWLIDKELCRKKNCWFVHASRCTFFNLYICWVY